MKFGRSNFRAKNFRWNDTGRKCRKFRLVKICRQQSVCKIEDTSKVIRFSPNLRGYEMPDAFPYPYKVVSEIWEVKILDQKFLRWNDTRRKCPKIPLKKKSVHIIEDTRRVIRFSPNLRDYEMPDAFPWSYKVDSEILEVKFLDQNFSLKWH